MEVHRKAEEIGGLLRSTWAITVNLVISNIEKVYTVLSDLFNCTKDDTIESKRRT